MRSFASLDDVQSPYLGRSFTGSAEAARAADWLEAVHASIATYTGIDLAGGTGFTEVVRAPWDAEVQLGHRPVRAITSVSRAYAYSSVPGTIIAPWSYAWNSHGTLYAACGTWGGPHTKLTVVYDYGYAPDSSEYRALAAFEAEKVAGLLRGAATNPEALRSESLGSYSATYSLESLTAAANALSGLERDTVDRIVGRRSRLYSVPLVRP